MSVQTRAPSGSWSRVIRESDYAATVSNYRATMKAAIEAEENTEIEAKIFEYNEGNLSFKDLREFLKGKISDAGTGTQRELDLKKILSASEVAETGKKREIKRSEMEAKFAKNGISASEQREIEERMLEFYKEGTPEHMEQLNSIAVAHEIETMEENNLQVARLQSELAAGGLTLGEEAQVKRLMQTFTEPDSAEFYGLESEIASLEAEAAQGFGAGAIAAETSSARAELALQKSRLADLNRKLEIGDITPADYLSQKEYQLSLILPQDISAGAISDEDRILLEEQVRLFQEEKAGLESGNLVLVETGSMTGGVAKRAVVPRDSVGRHGEEVQLSRGGIDSVTGAPIGDSTESARLVTTIDLEGNILRGVIGSGGEIEPVETSRYKDQSDILGRTVTIASPMAKPDKPADIQDRASLGTTRKIGPKREDITAGITGAKFDAASMKRNVAASIKNVTRNPFTRRTSGPRPSFSRPTAGRLPGTLDFGVSEKVGETFGRVKNFFGNLFGR